MGRSWFPFRVEHRSTSISAKIWNYDVTTLFTPSRDFLRRRAPITDLPDVARKILHARSKFFA
jgi:hypothetical protein